MSEITEYVQCDVETCQARRNGFPLAGQPKRYAQSWLERDRAREGVGLYALEQEWLDLARDRAASGNPARNAGAAIVNF